MTGPAPRQPDADDFAAWVSPHWTAMAVTAGRIAGLDDRDDALQDALISAWRHRASFDPERGTARAWLVAVTANAARKIARRRSRTSRDLHPDARQDADVSGNAARRSDSRVDLERGIAALPERQRLAVTVFYFAGLSIRETASVMQCAEGTVKATLSAARAKLREALEDDLS